MLRERLRASLAHVGVALREPEAFALHWHREGTPYPWRVFTALALTAILGTTTYGMIMGLLGGPELMFAGGVYCTLAAGIAWSLAAAGWLLAQIAPLLFRAGLEATALAQATRLKALRARIAEAWGLDQAPDGVVLSGFLAHFCFFSGWIAPLSRRRHPSGEPPSLLFKRVALSRPRHPAG